MYVAKHDSADQMRGNRTFFAYAKADFLMTRLILKRNCKIGPGCLVEARLTSRKHLRTKVTPDLHLTFSKNGGNLGLVLNDKVEISP